MKKILAITGPPSGGKSTAALRLSALANADLLSTGQIVGRIADTGDHRLLRHGCMYPHEEALRVAFQTDAAACERDTVIVDGMPRFYCQVSYLITGKLRGVEASVVILQPPIARIHEQVLQRAPAIARVQPQREALWYANQFHDVLRGCHDWNVPYCVLESLDDDNIELTRLNAWLKGEF